MMQMKTRSFLTKTKFSIKYDRKIIPHLQYYILKYVNLWECLIQVIHPPELEFYTCELLKGGDRRGNTEINGFIAPWRTAGSRAPYINSKFSIPYWLNSHIVFQVLLTQTTHNNYDKQTLSSKISRNLIRLSRMQYIFLAHRVCIINDSQASEWGIV